MFADEKKMACKRAKRRKILTWNWATVAAAMLPSSSSLRTNAIIWWHRPIGQFSKINACDKRLSSINTSTTYRFILIIYARRYFCVYNTHRYTYTHTCAYCQRCMCISLGGKSFRVWKTSFKNVYYIYTITTIIITK